MLHSHMHDAVDMSSPSSYHGRRPVLLSERKEGLSARGGSAYRVQGYAYHGRSQLGR